MAPIHDARGAATTAAATATSLSTAASMPQARAAVTIRQFRDADLPVVRALFSDGMMHYAVEGHPQYCVWVDYVRETLATDLADVRAHYMARDGDFWVATMPIGSATHSADGSSGGASGDAVDMNEESASSEVIVGILGISKRPGGVGELRRMSVRKEYRRFGIGQLLIAHVEQWAAVRGFTTLTLSNGNMMTQAHNFYLKLGYAYTVTTVLCADPLYEVKHFEKRLTPAATA